MMKKLLTLLLTSCTFMGVHAQSLDHYRATHRGPFKAPVSNVSTPQLPPVSAKSTAFMDRWYNHTKLVDQMNNNNMTYVLKPIWQDSTVLETFITGIGPINFSSMAEVFDPIHFTKWNDTTYFSSSLMTISDTDAYNVDSIKFSGCLMRGTANRPPTIVDTFILSIAVSNLPYYYATCQDELWVGDYIDCPGPDTLRASTILTGDIDSIERTQIASTDAIVWKIPIYDAMRHDVPTIDEFTYEVPGGLPVPVGKGFAVTVTFKSGDMWTPNVDTFSEYHNFSGLSGEGLGSGQLMPYYHYEYNDRGMSNSMFSVDPAHYYPAVFIEGWNSPSYKYEFHDISAHVGCNNCLTIAARYAASVEELSAPKISTTVYPVPAADEVNIAFSLEEHADATVMITNALGQEVANSSVRSASAHVEHKTNFNTSNLPSGIYFYTIQAGGSSANGRFVVSH